MIITSKHFSYALRHKVTLEQKIHTNDGAGGYSTAWEPVATLWAEIRRLRGGETFAGGQVSATGTHLFRLRYRRGLTPEMRFCYDNRIFNIRSIHNISEGDRVLEVYAEEGVA